MSILNVSRTANQQNPYCNFRFQDPNNPNHNPCKIMVKESDVWKYMGCMEKGWVFRDGKKEVQFQKCDGGTVLNTIVNGTTYPYTLFDSEKQQVYDWIEQNLV
ncbi:MAG: hypothetical protein IJL05_03860 [Alphaproteobacteria bacterium]|nr:hypothetical protein [Alphaproteobacteria bacterium]